MAIEKKKAHKQAQSTQSVKVQTYLLTLLFICSTSITHMHLQEH